MKKVFNYFPVTTDMTLAKYAHETKRLEARLDMDPEPETPSHLRGTFNGN